MRLRLSKSWKFCAGKDRKICVQLCIELAGWMLHLGGVADEVADGKTAERETDRFRQRARSVSSDGGTAGRRSASS